MTVRSTILAALLLVGPLAPAVSQAQTPTPTPTQAPAPSPLTAEERADAKIVRGIMISPPRTPQQLQTLREVLDRAPASYPLVEPRNGHIIVRGVGAEEIAALSLVAGLQAAGADKAEKKTVYVDAAFNVYPTAALMLGSDAVTRRRPEEAIAWLDKGLALQPDNLYLVTEKGAALAMLNRPADALALYDATLALGDRTFDPKSKARLRRARGWALIELGRLDEAEADYKQSLVLEPDHGGALRELKYIADKRAGVAKSEPVQIYTSDQAKAVK